MILGQSFHRGGQAVHLFGHVGGEDDRGRDAPHHHGQVGISTIFYKLYHKNTRKSFKERTALDLPGHRGHVIERTIRLLETHPLRTLDAIQVASALEWQAELFVSSDYELYCLLLEYAGQKRILRFGSLAVLIFTHIDGIDLPVYLTLEKTYFFLEGLYVVIPNNKNAWPGLLGDIAWAN